MTRSYYRNSVGGLLVFDLGNRTSFDNIQEWHQEVREHVQPHPVLFVLVGHKSDREETGERVVSKEEAEKLAGRLGMPYVEASSKTGENVTAAFELLTRRIYQGLLSGEVQLRDGWDGVKSSAPRRPSELSSRGESKVDKKCACWDARPQWDVIWKRKHQMCMALNANVVINLDYEQFSKI